MQASDWVFGGFQMGNFMSEPSLPHVYLPIWACDLNDSHVGSSWTNSMQPMKAAGSCGFVGPCVVTCHKYKVKVYQFHNPTNH